MSKKDESTDGVIRTEPVLDIIWIPYENYEIQPGNNQTDVWKWREEGFFVHYRNYGWATVWKPIQLNLTISNNEVIDVAPLFKRDWERLTRKRVKAIMNTTPEEVTLQGNRLTSECYTDWFTAAFKTAYSKAP